MKGKKIAESSKQSTPPIVRVTEMKHVDASASKKSWSDKVDAEKVEGAKSWLEIAQSGSNLI